ncbi:hypothetical protein F441_18380 [Phytophthora nicotianae CJ01A1]|uniref:Uncharacterized protein n=3 Tax=Phytophthora nicotianae TaxID=4792 RepID=W2I5S1_PHYNI|nr:hypothetical protein L915_18007 [Phytophthora nicotianae]ETL28797.1 hypothetical protein L916_17905 [Phytophthora nicotianae]ETL82035.1 hypothetical protein L917_17731 [Phytophthora nicotianae]ETO63852.1 hypothetical protein F444_18506 [Phytophthora nicotianae P1976]ETP04921.1 hypothetical protein F441_18380 [Phytophthora nicotianae CJ01A1]
MSDRLTCTKSTKHTFFVVFCDSLSSPGGAGSTTGNQDKRQDRCPPNQDRQEIRDHPGDRHSRSKDLGTVAKR